MAELKALWTGKPTQFGVCSGWYVKSLEICIDCPGWCGTVGWSIVCNGKVEGSIPGQGTYLGCWSRYIGEATL